MTVARHWSRLALVVVALTVGGLAVAGGRLMADAGPPASMTASLAPRTQGPEPWTTAQAIEPGELVKQLAAPRPASRPMVVYVGFRVLYRGGHVPTASFHGPASTPDGLAELKQWASGVPRSAEVVVYCGCCPLADCPNLRPAFKALRDMGFTRLRVLVLPHNFATDWIGKGYPVERQ